MFIGNSYAEGIAAFESSFGGTERFKTLHNHGKKEGSYPPTRVTVGLFSRASGVSFELCYLGPVEEKALQQACVRFFNLIRRHITQGRTRSATICGDALEKFCPCSAAPVIVEITNNVAAMVLWPEASISCCLGLPPTSRGRMDHTHYKLYYSTSIAKVHHVTTAEEKAAVTGL